MVDRLRAAQMLPLAVVRADRLGSGGRRPSQIGDGGDTGHNTGHDTGHNTGYDRSHTGRE
jgi:hypothetical protein